MLSKALIHKSITEERVCDTMEEAEGGLDSPGICLICGADADSVEPDAEDYDCEACGADAVMGVENILLRYFA
jgi:hypothetical protein